MIIISLGTLLNPIDINYSPLPAMSCLAPQQHKQFDTHK